MCSEQFRLIWRIGKRKLPVSTVIRLTCPACGHVFEQVAIELAVFETGREEFPKSVVAVETKRSWAEHAGKPMEQTPLGHAVCFLGDVALRDITADSVEDFRSYLLNQRVGPHRFKAASANLYVSILRHVLNCAVRWGDADCNPAACVKMLAEAPMPVRVLSEAEQAALLEAMPTWLRLITTFLLQTALRRGDVLNLAWAAVQGASLELCEIKEGNKRPVPLNSTARSILSVLLADRKPKPIDYVCEPELSRPYLRWKIRRSWRRAVKASGILPIRFHDLRLTALTWLVQSGAGVRTVQAIAGHSSLRTTQRYLHSSDKQKRAAVEKLDAGFGRYLPATARKRHRSDSCKRLGRNNRNPGNPRASVGLRGCISRCSLCPILCPPPNPTKYDEVRYRCR